MTKSVLVLMCVCIALATAACDAPQSSVSETLLNAKALEPAESSESQSLACTMDDISADNELVSANLPDLFASPGDTTPFRCLRFMDAATLGEGKRSVQIIDIRSGPDHGVSGAGQLQIPLHEIKTKSFLRNRSLAILSDGKRFAALEKECNDIKASGINKLYALLQADRRQLTDSRKVSISDLPKMQPQEFIAERRFGLWHVVNLTGNEDLASPLFMDMKPAEKIARENFGREPSAGLVRTLIVFDGDDPPEVGKGPQMASFAGQAFVLHGGLTGLQRYQVEATAMARALAQPRINARGCVG